MIGKSLWVRTFLVAVGILATMGMNINRIHTIGGFDNAPENNTHLLDRSYGSGGLLDGSMDRMPYDLGNSFDVPNDSITDMYVRNSINNTMDLSQVMDMEPEIFRFKENTNKPKPARIKREDQKGKVIKEVTEASFFYQSSALSIFSTRCISLSKEIVDLYQKSDSAKQITNDLLHKFSFHFNQFNFNGGVKINFTTVERRENAKSIFFALTDIANKVGNNIVKVNQNETNTPKTEALQNAKKIFELSSGVLIRMLINIPNYTKNRNGVLADFFIVDELSCNPICGNAILPYYSDRNHISNEFNNVKYKLFTLYDGTDNRCDEIREHSNTSVQFYNDIKKLINNYEVISTTIDHSNEFLIERFTALENDLYAKLKDKTLCLALRSCCSMRSLLKYLSKTAVVIDDACGVEGQTEPKKNVSYAFFTSLRKISNQSKDIIIQLITKIDECRTNSVETEEANVQHSSETQEISTTTVSSGDKTFKTEIFTDKPASLNNSSGSSFLAASYSRDASGNHELSEHVAVTSKSASSKTGVVTNKPSISEIGDVSKESALPKAPNRIVSSTDQGTLKTFDTKGSQASSVTEVVTNKPLPSINEVVSDGSASSEIKVDLDDQNKSKTEAVLDNQESSKSTVSQENQDQPRTGEVTNHEGNIITGNNFTSVGDFQTNNTQLKDDSKLQSAGESSSDKTENVAASSGYLHSSAVSNTLVSSLFILLATLLQRFQ